MDIMIAIYNHWTEKIFAGEKPFEFRTKVPSQFHPGDKIYFYEPKRFGGAAAVVGECTVDEIMPLLSKEGKWPLCMTHHFIEYYFEHIRKDVAKAEIYRQCKERLQDKATYVRFGAITDYALSEFYMRQIEETGRIPDIFEYVTANNAYDWYAQESKKMDECRKDHFDCDDWLKSMGMYNECDETCYKFAYHLTNIKRYEQPQPLSSFLNGAGTPINMVQSFCYVTGRI